MPNIGGSFAPALNKTQLQHYRALAEGAEDKQVAHYMLELADMLDTFWETPESSSEGKPGPLHGMKSANGGVVRQLIVELSKEEIERIDPVVPWKEDLQAMGVVFGKLDLEKEKELRDAAHHLLWYGYELYNGREPMTKDKVSF